MGNFTGKIGSNSTGWVTGDVKLTQNSKQAFKSKNDALQAARNNTGSELVYENKGQWFVGKVEETEDLWISESTSPLSKQDAANIHLDKQKMAENGLANAQLSFIEDDASYELLKLANDHSSSVRNQLAQRTDMPAEVYDKLADTHSSRVQHTLVRNPATPLSALRHIAKNGSSMPQRGLAVNPAARQDPEIRSALANSHSSQVRELMAMSDQDAQGMYQNYTNYVDGYDRHSALYDLANDGSSNVRSKVAARLDLPPEIYMELANDGSSNVRQILAQNPNISLGALRELANDGSSNVRMEVARHPLSHQDGYIMNQLANDGSSNVRSAFAEGPVFKLPYTFVPGVAIDPFSGGTIQQGVGNEINTQRQSSQIHQGDNINIQGDNNTVIIEQP